MTPTRLDRKGRIFAAELKSKRSLRSVSLGNDIKDEVSIEGTLGILVKANFHDDFLEVAGTQGTLRVDLTADEISSLPLRRPVGSNGGGREQ
jgi:hypothetical protein